MGVVIGFLFWTIILLIWYDKKEKERAERKRQLILLQQEKQKALARKYNVEVLVNECKRSIFDFAISNNKVRKTYYDIEEGGDYIFDYNSSDCSKIDVIMNDELIRQSPFFFNAPSDYNLYPYKIDEKTIEKIKSRISREMTSYSSKDNIYVGF